MYINKGKNSGMVALMLVLWTSLALAGLLFDVVSAYSSRLTAIKTEQKRSASRSVALLCRDMLLVELSENAGFAHNSGQEPFVEYKNLACSIVSFSSTPNISGGQTKLVNIQGRDASSTAVFNIEAKININAPGSVPEVVYTKEISEES